MMTTPFPADTSTQAPAQPEPRTAWGYCVWCDAPSTTHDRACPAPDGDGHLFKRPEIA